MNFCVTSTSAFFRVTQPGPRHRRFLYSVYFNAKQSNNGNSHWRKPTASPHFFRFRCLALWEKCPSFFLVKQTAVEINQILWDKKKKKWYAPSRLLLGNVWYDSTGPLWDIDVEFLLDPPLTLLGIRPGCRFNILNNFLKNLWSVSFSACLYIGEILTRAPGRKLEPQKMKFLWCDIFFLFSSNSWQDWLEVL